MSIKNSLNKLKQVIHAAQQNPMVPYRGKCECMTTIANKKPYCDCATFTPEGKQVFFMRYDGPCFLGRFAEQGCTLDGVDPTV